MCRAVYTAVKTSSSTTDNIESIFQVEKALRDLAALKVGGVALRCRAQSWPLEGRTLLCKNSKGTQSRYTVKVHLKDRSSFQVELGWALQAIWAHCVSLSMVWHVAEAGTFFFSYDCTGTQLAVSLCVSLWSSLCLLVYVWWGGYWKL